MNRITKVVLGTVFSVGLLLVGSLLVQEPVYAFSGAGTGSLADPYQITTCGHLQEIGDEFWLNYRLENDIDCSGTTSWNGGLGFEPITIFVGSLDGQNYTINDIYINRTGGGNVGVFALAAGSTIYDVHFRGGSITGSAFVGSIAAQFTNGATLTNFTSNTAINSTGGWAGGVVGLIADRSELDKIEFTGTLTSAGQFSGGIVGYNEASDIRNASVSGTLSFSGGSSGGLVGTMVDNSSSVQATLSNSYSAGEITPGGGANIGGLVGYAETSSITNSFAANTYTAALTGSQAGLMGYSHSNVVSGLYIDIYSCGCTSVISSTDDDSYTSINTGNSQPAYFLNNSTNAPLNSWDFTNTWVEATADYPKFINFTYTGFNQSTTRTNSTLTPDWEFTGTSATPGSYNVRYRKQGNSNWLTRSATASQITLTGLQGNTTYEIEVQAVATSGFSEWEGFTARTTANPANPAPQPNPEPSPEPTLPIYYGPGSSSSSSATSSESKAKFDLTLKVVDENGNPLEGALVIIQKLDLAAETDAEGIVLFEKVSIGEYIVEISYANQVVQKTIEVETEDEFELTLTLGSSSTSTTSFSTSSFSTSASSSDIPVAGEEEPENSSSNGLVLLCGASFAALAALLIFFGWWKRRQK